MRIFYITAASLILAKVAEAAAPSCASVGQQTLCNSVCASSCRGFPPGFAAAGCEVEEDCTNPPSWAAGSVCTCSGTAPSPSTPSPSGQPSPSPAAPPSQGVVGGYLLLKDIKELQTLAAEAETIPLTRIYLAFLSPTLVYKPSTKTLENTGLDKFDFTEVADSIALLQKGGVEVFLSMGGWDAGCNPYFYARYSVGGYGDHTPNFWEIQTYGNGNLDNCVASNQFCYVCEPKTENTTLASFNMFPEPKGHPTWEAAKTYVASKATDPSPQWNENMIPGTSFTDSKTGITVKLPGSNVGLLAGRNPYQDLVYLAKDLGVTGVDLDYEEMWHADYFKVDAPSLDFATERIEHSLFQLDARPEDPLGNFTGPWKLPQTVYKYAAITKDIQSNIAAISPSLKMGTAAAAVGAWSGEWWGGNLKGLWYHIKQTFPDLFDNLDVGVMTYDLSKDEAFHECPDENDCPLDKQVAFYMNTYKEASIDAYVGYEVGTPAYPNPVHDAANQLPLTKDMLSSIISTTQKEHGGGFLWEIFKDVADASQATPQDVAQAICRTVRVGDKRCSGTIPPKP